VHPARAASCVWQPLASSGSLESATLVEASGLAASHRDPALLWAVNDSGNAPVLHALDRLGRERGQVPVTGVHDVDWEDLASFELDGKPYLLIADVGDNTAARKHPRLYVVEEPAAGVDSVHPAWTIAFSYPDGPRDVESAAVDAATQTVLLLSKRESPPLVFSVALRAPADGEPMRARRVGPLGPPRAQPAGPERLVAVYSQPTSWDVSSQWVAVLTYGRVDLYRRSLREPVIDALGRAPQWLPMTALAQAEALAFAADGSLYVTGEGTHPSLLVSTCVGEGGTTP
jgi:hypothetical protein